MSPTVQKSGPQ